MFNLKIEVDGENITIQTRESERLIDVLIDNSLPIKCGCGGNKNCGKCQIICKEIPPTINDKKHLSKSQIESGVRIACDKKPRENLSIKIISKQDEKLENYLYIKPEPSLTNALAIDIGTTTVVAYLIVLGNVAKIFAFENPQKSIGADVMTRMEYAYNNKKNATQLKKMLTNEINKIFTKIFKLYPGILIEDVLVTGNTAMLHFFWGECTDKLGVSPYLPKFLNTKTSKNTFFSNLDSFSSVFTAPCFGPFVGGDIACALLAAKAHEWEKPSLLIDIGTNVEMVIGTKNNLYCCATNASGAFEGACLSCGMSSICGAINKVFLENNKIKFETINDVNPCGICGSGAIDALAVMLETNAVDTSGYLDESHENVCCIDDKLCFKLSDNVFITQKDIREIQLAKSAIFTGIKILLSKINLSAKDLDKVYLAGAFGTNIDVLNAIKLKIFPDEFKDKIVNIANAAACGAVLTLCNREYLDIMKTTTNFCVNINLADEENFKDMFIDNLIFE